MLKAVAQSVLLIQMEKNQNLINGIADFIVLNLFPTPNPWTAATSQSGTEDFMVIRVSNISKAANR